MVCADGKINNNITDILRFVVPDGQASECLAAGGSACSFDKAVCTVFGSLGAKGCLA